MRPETSISDWATYFDYYKFTLFSEAIRLEKFIRTIVKFVPEGESILEAGFGSGLTSILLADIGYRITAIDIDKKLVERLKDKTKSFSNITVVWADMFNLPFRNDSFYAVIHQGVLEHFTDDQIKRALSEQKRVCSHHIIFDVPSERSTVPSNEKGTEFDFRTLSTRRWKTFVEKCGLSIEYGYGRAGYIYYLLPLAFHRLGIAPFKHRSKGLRKLSRVVDWLCRLTGVNSGFVCKKNTTAR